MQISTRTEDFIVDTLELRSDMYILNESLTDPAIVKVSPSASCLSWDHSAFWPRASAGRNPVISYPAIQHACLLNSRSP